jgi:hypothetical protein
MGVFVMQGISFVSYWYMYMALLIFLVDPAPLRWENLTPRRKTRLMRNSDTSAWPRSTVRRNAPVVLVLVTPAPSGPPSSHER